MSAFPIATSESLAVARYGYVFFLALGKASCVNCLSNSAKVPYPEIEDEQGVSVCVPAAYVKGIDTDGDGVEDVTAETGESRILILMPTEIRCTPETRQAVWWIRRMRRDL